MIYDIVIPGIILCYLLLRIILNTLKFGAVGTAVTTAAFGPDVSIPFFLGSAAGALYLYLLGRRTDRIGEG
jgi:hypothetical protein